MEINWAAHINNLTTKLLFKFKILKQTFVRHSRSIFLPLSISNQNNSTHLAPSHAMEEKLLRLYPRHEPSVYEAPGPRGELKVRKTRQGFTGNHHGRPFSLQLYLSQQTRNLHGVHPRPLTTRFHHELQIVVGEFREQTGGQANPVDVVGVTVQSLLVFPVDDLSEFWVFSGGFLYFRHDFFLGSVFRQI